MSSTNHPHDDELRDRLRMLGRHSEQRSPNFQHVWRNARQILAQREKTPWPSLAGWAATAATAVIVAGALLWMRHPPRQPHLAAPHIADATPATPTSVAFDATTPTDFLLTASDESRKPSVEQLTREIDALLNP